MAKSELISELVQTVRQLNWDLRPKINNQPGGDPPGNSLHLAITELRNHEIQTSQMIRSISLAETAVADDGGRQVEHADPTKVGSRQLLSEFGTAREAILSILRNLTDEEWSATHQTVNGEQSYDSIVEGLIESDRKSMEAIKTAAN